MRLHLYHRNASFEVKPLGFRPLSRDLYHFLKHIAVVPLAMIKGKPDRISNILQLRFQSSSHVLAFFSSSSFRKADLLEAQLLYPVEWMRGRIRLDRPQTYFETLRFYLELDVDWTRSILLAPRTATFISYPKS